MPIVRKDEWSYGARIFIPFNDDNDSSIFFGVEDNNMVGKIYSMGCVVDLDE